MSREPDPSFAELALPPDNSACGAGCALLFAGTFVAIAVDNLAAGVDVPLVGRVASVLWLALVAFCVIAGVWFVGLRGAVVECLGPFSKRHFAEVRGTGADALLGFGYTLFGRRLYFLRLRPTQVVSVSMGTGQATALAGRDMKDWSVVLRYSDPERPPTVFEGRPIFEVYIIGPAREREQTAELFATVVAFLRAAGVELHATDSDTEFRASPAE